MEHRFPDLPLLLSHRLQLILEPRGWAPPDSLALQRLASLASENLDAANKVLDCLQNKTKILKSTSAVIMLEIKNQRQLLSPAGGGVSGPVRQGNVNWGIGARVDQQPEANAPGSVGPILLPGQFEANHRLNHAFTQHGSHQKSLAHPSYIANASIDDFQRRRGPVTPEKCSPAPAVPLSPASPARPSGSAHFRPISSRQVSVSQEHSVVRKLDLEGTPRAKTPRIEPPLHGTPGHAGAASWQWENGSRHPNSSGSLGGSRELGPGVSNAGNASLNEWMEGVPGSQQAFAFPGPVRLETPPLEEPSLLINEFAMSQQGADKHRFGQGTSHGFNQGFAKLDRGVRSRDREQGEAGSFGSFRHAEESPRERTVQIQRTPSSLALEDKHVQSITTCSPGPHEPLANLTLVGGSSPLPLFPSPSSTVPTTLTGTWRLETSGDRPPRLVLQTVQPAGVLQWEQPLGLAHVPQGLLTQRGFSHLEQRVRQGAIYRSGDGSLRGFLFGQELLLEPAGVASAGMARGPMPPSVQRELHHRGGEGGACVGSPGRSCPPPPAAVLSAFGELEFKQRWLVEYHGGNQLSTLCQSVDVQTLASALETFRALSLHEFEARLVALLSFLPREQKRQRIASTLSVADQNVTYAVKVRKNRTVELLPPSLEKAGTAGGRLFGYDRLLTVYVDDLSKNRTTCEAVLRGQLSVCGRQHVFLLPKDATTKDVRILFLSLSSDAPADARAGFIPYASLYHALARVAHFHTCANVAKFLARLQLPFSKTWQAFDLRAKGATLYVVDDIPCKDFHGNVVRERLSGKALIHNDGNGFISEDLAELVPAGISQGCLPQERKSSEVPLVIQFRLFHNGEAYKGTVTLNRTLPPKTIVLPKSCRKVTRDQGWADSLPEALSSFEVCQSSQAPSSDARLNQQLILLLRHGGVPPSVFLRMAQEAIDDLLTSCTDPAAAYRLAASYGSEERPKQQATEAIEMLFAGFDMRDVQLRRTVRTLQKERFVELSKGRVPVKNTYSNLMGVADPTGQLEPDEVMVILPDGARYQTCEKVLVFRQPGLHPGDIRVFKARKVPGVEELVGTSGYAIIFSVKGGRSAPDMMAGGDLDGDPYWVCFNEELCGPFRQSDPQAHLEPSGQSPEPLPQDVDKLTSKLREHFLMCTYTIQSAIGTAQRNWLAWADQDGPGSATCLALNELYCRALDAGKSGEKVTIPRDLYTNKYPTYMEKEKDVRERGGNLTSFIEYESKSVLGQIHKLVYPQLQEVHEGVPEMVIFDEDVKLDLAKNAELLSKWTPLLKAYKVEVSAAMGIKDMKAKQDEMERVKLKYKKVLWEGHLKCDESLIADTIARLESKDPPSDVILAARAAYSATYVEANVAFERQRDKKQVSRTAVTSATGL